MLSDLTYKIAALPGLVQVEPNECVDWALEMLDNGYSSQSLIRLSHCRMNESYFKVKPLLQKAFNELGLQLKTGDDAVISYSYYHIKKIAKSVDVKQNLTEVYKFCQQRDYEGIVHDFYLLYWAWDQIYYDDTNQNHYWEGVNKKNIEATVVDVAKNWLNEYKNHYIQKQI